MIFDSSLTWPRRGDWPDGLAFAGVWRDTAKPFWPRPTGRRVCTYAECGSANRETHTHTYTSLTRSRFTQPTGSSPDYSEKSDACAQPLIPGHCSIYPSASSSSNSLSLSRTNQLGRRATMEGVRYWPVQAAPKAAGVHLP